MDERLSKFGELVEARTNAGETVLLFNCTNLVDCLDQDRTTWEIGARSKTRVRVLRYWFLRRRLPAVGTVFKLTETATVEVLTVDDSEDSTVGLVAATKAAGLGGLVGMPLDDFARHNEAMWGFDPRFENRHRQ